MEAIKLSENFICGTREIRMASTVCKRRMTTIQESQFPESYHLLVKVKEIHLGVIKKSEHIIITPQLRKCLRIDYKQITKEPE